MEPNNHPIENKVSETEISPLPTETSAPETSGAHQALSIPAAIIVGSLLIAAAILLAPHLRSQTELATATSGTAQATAPTTVDAANIITANEPFIGNPNAPTLAFFSDFQCPYCKAFETQVLPDIITQDVNTGKLKVVFKDFTFLGPDSTTAALFARAVWQLYPAQYFAWRTAMFNAQDAEDSGFGDRASIEQLTRTVTGIDQAKVSAAVDANSATYQKEIDADYAEGQQLGVQGTPAIFVGTSYINGLQPESAYTSAIAQVVK